MGYYVIFYTLGNSLLGLKTNKQTLFLQTLNIVFYAENIQILFSSLFLHRNIQNIFYSHPIGQ